jgi:N-acyl-L-homoserine lactone synthetase
VRIIIAKTPEEKNLSYQLRYKVYCEDLGWLPVEDATRGEQDEFDVSRSIIFLALGHSGEAIGTSRLILPGNSPLPIEEHFELHQKEEIERLYGKIRYGVEVSRFIVLKNTSVKEHHITLMLCKAMIRMCIASGVSHMFLSADHRFFRLLRMLGFCLYEMGKPRFFMGSKAVPGVLPLSALSEIRNKKPALYEYLAVAEKHVDDMAFV